MTTYQLVDGSGTAIDAGRVESFVSAFRGAVMRHGDAEYDTARRIWNASIDKRPGLIARCSGLADVIAAVRFGREHGLLVGDPRRRTQRRRPGAVRRRAWSSICRG